MIKHQLTSWFVKTRVNRIRFWSEEEWKALTDKEKIWIWYKHHWLLIGQGNAEVDQLLFFTQGEFLTLFGMWMANVGIWNLPIWTIPAPFVLFVFNKYVMWRIGNWKDDKDLIALETEWGNRRNKVFREIRKKEMNQKFRKELSQSL